MSETANNLPDEQKKPETDEPLFEADPALGQYVAHYPSNRAMLLLRGAALYSVPVLALQLVFADLDDQTAAVFLPATFAAIALGVAWYILHLWNREVVLYERGFTYREGSRLGQFLYMRIYVIRQQGERVRYFGIFPRDLYRAVLITDQDETLILTNLYAHIADLTSRLEQAITRARLPVVEIQLQRGETLDFGAAQLSAQGITAASIGLAWADFAGHRIEGKDLLLSTRTHADSIAIPLKQLDNALLFLALLRRFATR